MGADNPRRKTIAIEDILGVADVLELAGITNRRVLIGWRQEKGFPEPFKAVSSGELWDRQAVLRWLERHRSNGR